MSIFINEANRPIKNTQLTKKFKSNQRLNPISENLKKKF